MGNKQVNRVMCGITKTIGWIFAFPFLAVFFVLTLLICAVLLTGLVIDSIVSGIAIVLMVVIGIFDMFFAYIGIAILKAFYETEELEKKKNK